MLPMDETGFAELDQAAVAGAEGTAWGIPDFTPEPSLVQTSCYSTFSSDAPFAFVKQEESLLGMSAVPQSPTEQTSLCSMASEEAFVKINEESPRLVSIPMSPTSPIAKPRRRSTPTRSKTCRGQSLAVDDMSDLKGTTAARSRKMTEDERRVMLHKRRLRNRASAARSREKRSRTLHDLSSEVEELMKKAAALAEQARSAVEEAQKLKAKNILLTKENELLKSELKM